MGHSLKSNKYILTCSCKDMPQFAKDAFPLLYPNEPTPQVYAGKIQILDLVESLPPSNFTKYAYALANNKEKFAYYFEVDDDGAVVTQVNLKTGTRVWV